MYSYLSRVQDTLDCTKEQVRQVYLLLFCEIVKLHLASHYTVNETLVQPKDWVADKTLGELNLTVEGVLVLGVQRADGTYIGAPTGNTKIAEDDTMILYGRHEALAELDRRRTGLRGDSAHKKAIVQQKAVIKEQNQQEREQEKIRQLEEAQAKSD